MEKPVRFRVVTSRSTFAAPQLVAATGGLAIPATGATALGFEKAVAAGLQSAA